MASKQSYILTIARAKSLSFSTIFQEIKALLDAAGKFEKSSQAFGIAIEVYCQKASRGGNPFKKEHRKGVTTWDLDALMKISKEKIKANVEIHNQLYAELKKAGKGRAGMAAQASTAKRLGRNTSATSPSLNRFR